MKEHHGIQSRHIDAFGKTTGIGENPGFISGHCGLQPAKLGVPLHGVHPTINMLGGNAKINMMEGNIVDS